MFLISLNWRKVEKKKILSSSQVIKGRLLMNKGEISTPHSFSKHKVLVNTKQEIAYIPLGHTLHKWQRRGVYKHCQTFKIECFVKFLIALHLRCLAGLWLSLRITLLKCTNQIKYHSKKICIISRYFVVFKFWGFLAFLIF